MVSEGYDEREGSQDSYPKVSKIVSQVLPVTLFTLIGSLVAGSMLGLMVRSIESLPGLLVLIPAIMDTRGNIYAALGSRLSSGLHLGILPPSLSRDRNLMNAVLASLINSVVISVAIATLAYLMLVILGWDTIPIWALAFISLSAGTMSGLILTFIVLLTSIAGFKYGLDPDNLVGPITTIIGDMTSTISLLIVSELVLGLLYL